MFITPLIILPLLAIGAKFDVHDVFSDPVFVVSNVLLLASPPALTLAQITQAASGDAFERLISRTIFWAYCVVTPPMTIVIVVIGLILAKL
jgi:predicted permease